MELAGVVAVGLAAAVGGQVAVDSVEAVGVSVAAEQAEDGDSWTLSCA